MNKEKGNYIKEVVEELSKNYVIKPFNLTLNISQRTENIVMRNLNNLMFNFIYDYIELYELNRDTFINSVLELTDKKRKKLNTNLMKLRMNFLMNMRKILPII